MLTFTWLTGKYRSRFFELGDMSEFHLITDPLKQVEPFILSGEVPRDVTIDLYPTFGFFDRRIVNTLSSYCKKRDAALPNPMQVLALRRAMSPGGSFQNGGIRDLTENYIWSTKGIQSLNSGYVSIAARCVRPVTGF